MYVQAKIEHRRMKFIEGGIFPILEGSNGALYTVFCVGGSIVSVVGR